MKSHNLTNCLATTCLLLLGAFVVSAQEATIVGTVTDPSGAPVPAVSITITNTETAQVRHVVTNSVGQYVIPDVHIGSYTARAEVPSFKVAQVTAIVLNVGDRYRIDFSLEIGSAQESINIEGNAIAVQTDSGEISDLITGEQIAQLATNGRSLYTLATLTAGASSNMVDFQKPVPVGADPTVSFNGLRVSHNLYMVDGGEDYDRGGAGNISIMPSLDSIAEFRTFTSNYSAEYGLSSAATITMQFRSGTKDFHVSGWEFFRNDALDANNLFFNAAGLNKPELRFNLFGFNVAGPFVIPKFYNENRKKTFFFYNMEWRKLRQGAMFNQPVPLPSTYGGVFNTPISVPTADKLAPQILQKFTSLGLKPGAPFPHNTIPASLLDRNAQVLLQAGIFPAPNDGTRFLGGPNQPTDVREEIVRIDHQFSEKFWIFGHWVDEQITQTYGNSVWNGNNVPTVSTVFRSPSYSGVIHATNSITPNLLNETAFNYNGNRINIVPEGLVSRPSGLNIPELFTGNKLDRIPSILLRKDIGSKFDIGSWPWNNTAGDYQIRDDVSWIKGAHQLKIGGSWALYKKVQDLFGNTQGSFAFNGNYTGNDFADFLLGLSNGYTELALQDHGYWNNVSWAAYFQDNWRVNSRLTLNLGLRWDGVPHTYEANNRMANFYPNLYDPTKAAIILRNGTISPKSPGLGGSPNPILNGLQFYLNGLGIAGENNVPEGLVDNHWAAFGPRIGFAYDLTGGRKTVMRGGFGIMYERIQGGDMYNPATDPPFSSNVILNNVSLSNPNLNLLTGETLKSPITVSTIAGLSNTDYKLPASYQYSIGLQREIRRDSVVSVAYVGNTNRHQNDYRDINLPDPSLIPALIKGTVAYNRVVPYLGYHAILLSENGMNSHYNSLQVNLRSRVGDYLTLQFAYTFSHAYDAFSADLGMVSNPYDRSYDFGPGGLDRTHIALANFIYEFPFFKHSSRALKTSLGGWQLSGIVIMETGIPLNIALGGTQGSNGLAQGNNRPDLVGQVTYPQTVPQWFNTSAFAKPALGAWGNLGHNALRAPGRDNWNLSVFKNFVFNERRDRLEFRVESFNTWNHTQFNNVSTSFSSTNFGAVTSTWDARVFQLGMKLVF